MTRQVVVDDSDKSIQYSANWSDNQESVNPDAATAFGNFGAPFRRTVHSTTTTGSTVKYSFSGTSVTVTGSIDLEVSKTDGTADPSWFCFVDELPISNPSPNFAFPENNWVLCQGDDLSPGPHQLTLQVTIKGQKTFWFDTIQYTPLPGASISPAVYKYTNNDSAISYGPGWTTDVDNPTSKVTQIANSQVSFDFVGTSVALVGVIPSDLAHDESPATYVVDGGTPKQFILPGLAGNTTMFNQFFFTTPDLPAGPHHLVITYNGDKTKSPLSVDYFIVADGSVTTTTSSSISSSPSPSSTNILSPGGAQGKSKTPTAAIAGGVVGGLVILALVAVGLFLWRRKRRNQGFESSDSQTFAHAGPPGAFTGTSGGVSTAAAWPVTSAISSSPTNYTQHPNSVGSILTPYTVTPYSAMPSAPGDREATSSHLGGSASSQVPSRAATVSDENAGLVTGKGRRSLQPRQAPDADPPPPEYTNA